MHRLELIGYTISPRCVESIVRVPGFIDTQCIIDLVGIQKEVKEDVFSRGQELAGESGHVDTVVGSFLFDDSFPVEIIQNEPYQSMIIMYIHFAHPVKGGIGKLPGVIGHESF